MAPLPPDLTVLDPDGQSIRLVDLVSAGPAIVCFLRHFG